MVELCHVIALVFAGLFAGGVLMEAIVEHPARLAAEAGGGIDVMQRVLERADPYMPGLALAGFAAGLASYLLGGPALDLAAALLLLAIVPFTILLLVPINKRILAYRPSAGGAIEIVALMKRWTPRHAIRSVAGVLAFLLLATRSLS